MDYLKAFLVGGLLCVIGQILIDRTKLTPARILVAYVVAGVLLGAVGLYDKLVDFAGAGATVPLTGFGNTLARGVKKAVDEDGALGILTGGLTASAAGITAAVIFGLLASFIFKPKDKGSRGGYTNAAAKPRNQNSGGFSTMENRNQNQKQNQKQNQQNQQQSQQQNQNENRR